MQRESTIDAVLERVAEEGDPREALLVGLARELLRRDTGADEAADPAAIVAAVRGLVELADARGTAPAIVRAFTPTLEEHGYETPGSVLQTDAPDQPFLVETILECLRDHGLQARTTRHPIVGVERDAEQRLVRIEAADEHGPLPAESLVHVELDRRLTPGEIAGLEDDVRDALADARRVAEDFSALYRRVLEIADEVGAAGDGIAYGRVRGGPTPAPVDPAVVPTDSPEEDPDEVAALLAWLADDNAVLLGAADYRLDGDQAGRPVPGSALGLLADDAPATAAGEPIEPPAEGTFGRLRSGELISIGHTVSLSTVHRRTRMEDVAVRSSAVGPDGEPILLLRRLVLHVASRAYAAPASETPLLRGTLRRILDDEGLRPGSHDWKALVALFDSFPKDELFAMPTADLHRTLMAFVHLSPGQLALRARRSADGRAATVVVAVPRSSYDASVRDALRQLAREGFGTERVTVYEVLGEGEHAYLHLQAYDPDGLGDVDVEVLEREAARLARSWEDRLREALVAREGGERGRVLAARWSPRLPGQYKAGVDPSAAVHDVVALERLTTGGEDLLVTLKHEQGDPPAPEADGRTSPDRESTTALTRVAFVVRGRKVELSRAMPILEHLGLHVIEERPTHLRAGESIWIQDFGVLGPDGRPLDLDAAGDRIAAVITAAWRGETESDSLNRLVVLTSMGHERLEVLRAYRSYRQRIGSRFTESYQNEVIVEHAEITEKLVRLFELRFGGTAGAAEGTDGTGGTDRAGGVASPRDEAAEQALYDEIVADLDAVPSLDHDRILRNQLHTIDATYRTNAYRPGRRALALKIKSAEVPAIPHPAPLWEVYVHGLDVEGIHLRGGMIARGGLRWSDRMDYRTEVLGLMRAQMVKNAVIVPAGAKGGFRLRGSAGQADAAARRAAVADGYVAFVSALLDVTDDLHDGVVTHPDGVRVLDEDDTYLVVAADKGTASFSDTANAIAVERGFWLGDAFASGGSTGYDHKRLGITARGAWVSVRRHFGEIGVDPEADPITVVGIGDMSGDVFGNGMLRSRSMKLVAAYDHRHVFVDPDPADPAASWAERQRLFTGGRTSWDDYDRSLISAGGGVFPRDVKRVETTPQMREALGIEDEALSPSELIRAVLRAPVDLLWNGGIGTVVKASTERDADAEDRASDAIRVDGRDLRATVVGEGGNLGFTRAARVEYARGGGRINADFIDNSAGVDCSDHEVNLKVLLDLAVRRGLLDVEQRNALLAEVTDDVVAHVLADSFAQARVLTQEERRAPRRTQAAEELMAALEEDGRLQRADYGLPGAEEIADRRTDGEGLTRPELAFLVALAKSSVTRELLGSDLLDDPALADDLIAYFPSAVTERFGELVAEHPLRRQLLAMLGAGEAVNALGPTFVARRAAEFGTGAGEVVRAFRVAVGATDARDLWTRIDALEGIDPDVVWGLRSAVDELVRVTSRWHMAEAPGAPIATTIEAHRDGTRAIRERLEELQPDEQREQATAQLVERGVPEDLADAVTAGPALLLAPHAIAAASAIGRPVVEVAQAVLHTGEALSLDGLHRAIGGLPIPDRLTRWSAQALRDDLLQARAMLARRALEDAPDDDPTAAVDDFLAARPRALVRLRLFLRELSTDGRGGSGGSASASAPSLAVRQLQAMVELDPEPATETREPGGSV